jgi:hypothetical protein
MRTLGNPRFQKKPNRPSPLGRQIDAIKVLSGSPHEFDLLE